MQDNQLLDSLNLGQASWNDGPNPCTQGTFELYGEKYQLAPLNETELHMFQSQFGTLLAAPGSEERRLMLNRVRAYMLALRAVKNSLGDPKFVGLNPGDTEMGFGLIRPVFTMVNGVVKADWTQALTQAYADWFDTAGGLGVLIGDSFGLCITHLKSFVTPVPFMSEAVFTIGRSGAMIPIDTRGLRLGDTINGVPVLPIPTMVLVPKSALLARARSDVNGMEDCALGGLVFGLGRALAATTAYPTA